MRRAVITLTLLLILAASAEVTIPRWFDPLGREPLSFSDWLESNPEREPAAFPRTLERIINPQAEDPEAGPYPFIITCAPDSSYL